jgi:hypothetical protein
MMSDTVIFVLFSSLLQQYISLSTLQARLLIFIEGIGGSDKPVSKMMPSNNKGSLCPDSTDQLTKRYACEECIDQLQPACSTDENPAHKEALTCNVQAEPKVLRTDNPDIHAANPLLTPGTNREANTPTSPDTDADRERRWQIAAVLIQTDEPEFLAWRRAALLSDNVRQRRLHALERGNDEARQAFAGGEAYRLDPGPARVRFAHNGQPPVAPVRPLSEIMPRPSQLQVVAGQDLRRTGINGRVYVLGVERSFSSTGTRSAPSTRVGVWCQTLHDASASAISGNTEFGAPISRGEQAGAPIPSIQVRKAPLPPSLVGAAPIPQRALGPNLPSLTAWESSAEKGDSGEDLQTPLVRGEKRRFGFLSRYLRHD